MEKTKSYCEFVQNIDEANVHKIYHDTQYGFPIDTDNELFGRLILEINQAGLSWTTILNKKDNFKLAYSLFDIKKISNYTEKEVERLLNNKGIIRNRLKINAAIFNAQKIVSIQNETGSFKKWLDQNYPMELDKWVILFKKTFKFTGGEITKEFLISTGYLKGAHVEGCPVFSKVISKKPMWNKENIA